MRVRKSYALALAFAPALVVGVSAADGVPADNPLLLSSTYVSGVGVFTVAKLGPDGALWLAGDAQSLEIAGAANTVPHAGASPFSDAFVVRLDPATRTLLSAAWIGGDGSDTVVGLDFDAAGRAYVAGVTESPDFPVRAGDPVASFVRGKTFAARVAEDARGFDWVRTIGGGGRAVAKALAMTDDGDPVVVGETRQRGFELVAPLPGTGDGRVTGGAFATRFRAADGEIVFSTKFDDVLRDVFAVAATPGRLLLAGETSSRDVPGALRILPAPGFFELREGTLVEIDQAGTQLLRVGLLGSFQPRSLVARAGAVYLGGSLRETPFQPGAVFTPEPMDAGVLRLDPATWDVAANTVLHGEGLETSISIADGDDGAVWVACESRSRDMPLAASIRPRPAGVPGGFPADFHVATLDPDTLAVTFATYLGGSGNEFGPCLATVAGGGAWLAGSTQSSDFVLRDPVATSSTYEGLVVAEIRHGEAAFAPSAPLDVTAQAVEGPMVRLSFRDGGGGAAGIAIDRQDEGRWRRVAVVAPDATEWTDTDVLMDHAYSYALQAVNAYGGSPVSGQASVILEPTLAVDLTEGQFAYARSRDGRGTARLAGTVARLGGGPVDLPAAGFAIVFYSGVGAQPVLTVPAGAPGWTERRGRQRFRSGAVRLDFDPATGAFRARANTMVPFIQRGLENPLQMRCGRDAGTTSDVWRELRNRNLRMR